MILSLLVPAFADEPIADTAVTVPPADPATVTVTSTAPPPSPPPSSLQVTDLAFWDAPAPAPEPTTQFSTRGELRLLGSLPPAVVVDTEGNTLGQGPVLDSRLRAALAYRNEAWTMRAEADLFTGQIAGDPWDIRGSEDARNRESIDMLTLDAFRLRRLSADGMVGPAAVEVGLVTSHWGLGMLANDGAHGNIFGRSDFGDRVIRVRAATRPLAKAPLTLVLAGDRVVDDELATWNPIDGTGPTAWQGIASAVYGKADTAKAGIYGVFRHQTEADGERVTQAGVLDLYGDAPISTPTLAIRVAAEAAGILGRTDRGQSYNSRDGLDVRSAGATALVEIQPRALPLRFLARAGWASGDADPDDGYSQDFSFDRDFDAGMVLFDEVQGAIDAAAYAQLTDPEHSGTAPDGAEALVAEGALRHAAFVQPAVALRPFPWLLLKTGVTFAWNTAPISQPYATFRNGGVPANHLGQATSGYALGTEIDWSATLGGAPLDLFGVASHPALVIQGGHLLASADLGGGTYTLLTATARMRW